MALPLNYSQITKATIQAIKAGLTPYIEGSPGIGKSAIPVEICERFNLKLIDLRLSQCEPTDLLGFPSIDKAANKASYVPMDTFPIKGDVLPLKTAEVKDTQGNVVTPAVYYSGWLLFLDELSHADRSTQKASYKLILDKKVGDVPLHSNVLVVAAGNKESDNAFVEPMSTALQSRLCHLDMEIDVNDWIEWALNSGIDHRITSYIKWKPKLIYTFKPNHTEKTYACPRTWEHLSKVITQIPIISKDDLPIIAGIVSESVAREFNAFCKLFTKIITADQIIANPHGIDVPSDPAVLYALTGSLAHNMTDVNCTSLMAFIGRLPMEFQVLTMREVVRRDKSIAKLQPIKDWRKASAIDLYS